MEPVTVLDSSSSHQSHPSPWLTTWFSPRITVRRLLDADPARSWFLVVFLAGISLGLSSLVGRYGELVTWPGLLIAAAVSPVLVAVALWVSSFVTAIVGGWFGGKGDAKSIRQASAWSLVPVAASAVLWVPLIAAYGLDLFKPNPPPPGTLLAVVTIMPLVLAIVGANLWSLVIFVACMGEALQVSTSRALGVVIVLYTPVLIVDALLR